MINILTNNDLLHEITKWHILPYINFPDIFLDIISNDDNINKLEWLFTESYITIELLNDYVKKVTAYLLLSNNYQHKYMETFIEYILFYKKCPKMFVYIFNKFKNEREIFINSKILEMEKIQKYLKDNSDNYVWLYKNKYVTIEPNSVDSDIDIPNQYTSVDFTIDDGHEFFVNHSAFTWYADSNALYQSLTSSPDQICPYMDFGFIDNKITDEKDNVGKILNLLEA
jgi:hypothetical protein